MADGLEMHAPGAPRLRAGDEAVLFAYPTATGLWRLRGWSQGLRRIERDASGRALVRTAEPGVVGLEKVGPTAAASLPRTVASEPLEAFLTRVEALLAREAGR
ncbi:MAG: hypothetical protein GC160_03965 [Acidobacteria bacterium]|nr:hypothetical protein [Acidobacteriota bacterium]